MPAYQACTALLLRKAISALFYTSLLLNAISVIFGIDSCQLLHNLSNRKTQPENEIQTADS
jgi:hypothetical protein